MTSYTHTQTVDSRSTEVFQVLTNFQKYPEWDPLTLQVTDVPDAPIEIGSSFTVTMPRTGKQTLEVTGIEEGKSLTLSPTSRLFNGSHRYDISDQDGKTQIIHTFSMSTKGLGHLFIPLLPVWGWMFRRHTRSRAAALEEYLSTRNSASDC